MATTAIEENQVPAGLFCVWRDDQDRWTCRRCNAQVLKAASEQVPFAGCKVGMKAMGVTPVDLVKAVPRAAVPEHGPGTELKAMLSWLGITAKPDCSCNRRAVQMNIWGADTCEQKMDEIVGWLREEAGKRKLPFLEPAARKIVQWAIDRARNKSDATKM